MASKKSVSLKAQEFYEILFIRKNGHDVTGYAVHPAGERLIHVDGTRRLISWHGTMRLLHSADEMNAIISEARKGDLYLSLDKRTDKGKRFPFNVDDFREHMASETFGPSSEFKPR